MSKRCRFCNCLLTGTEEQEGICSDCNEEPVEATVNDRFLSKAKTIQDGEWVEGYYYSQLIKVFDLDTNKYLKEKQRCHYIIPVDGDTEPSEIDPETLCQCTGLKDKNGKLIFENDIVFAKSWKPSKMKIIWDESAWILCRLDIKKVPMQMYTELRYMFDSKGCMCEVVDNTYNKEEI